MVIYKQESCSQTFHNWLTHSQLEDKKNIFARPKTSVMKTSEKRTYYKVALKYFAQHFLSVKYPFENMRFSLTNKFRKMFLLDLRHLVLSQL